MLRLLRDEKVTFPAFYIRGPRATQTRLREFVAQHALMWLRFQYQRQRVGCVVFDIDDTLINCHENCSNGFEFMAALYNEVKMLFPVHIVTARPRDQHKVVMELLNKKLKLSVPPDRLHMLPSEKYDLSHHHVEEFKWKKHLELEAIHTRVLARLGDRMWDVASLKRLPELEHVKHSACYIFFDPLLKGALSSKLPGPVERDR